MRMIFLTQYFAGPSQPGSGRPWQTASFFGNRGHQVKLLVSDLDYATGKPRQEGRPEHDKLPPTVSLHTVRSFGFGKSMFSRAVQYISYTLFALVRGLLFRKIDVVLASSPPIFVGLAGYLVALAKGAKFVLEIRDPWPAAPVYFGVLKNPVVIRILLKLERFLYNRAHLIVPVTPGMKRHIQQKGISGDKIEVITTGYDPEIFAGCPEPGWPAKGKAMVIYTGSLGAINETGLLMEVVELLRDQPEIQFTFLGSGTCKAAMQQIAVEKGLTNVTFLPPVPRKEVAGYLSGAQIAIVATRPGFYSEIGLHNKMFDYMGAGLPVVISGTGDIKDIIQASGGGLVVEPGNPRAFAAAVLYLAYNPDLCAIMGRRAKAYVNGHFHRAKLLARYEAAILQLFAGNPGGTIQNGPAER